MGTHCHPYYHLPLSLLLEPIFCVLVPDYINAHTILQHTWAFSSESSGTQGFTRSPYIRISSALQRYSLLFMFSCFSDIIRNQSEYQNLCIRRILWNTATTYKICTKALSAILDAMKLIRSPPVDSCS